MQNNRLSTPERKKLIIIAVALCLAIIAIIIISFVVSRAEDAKDTVQITGLSSCASHIDHDTEVRAQKNAFQYVAAQLELGGQGPTERQYTGTLREGSCKLSEFEYDDNHTGYTAEFILDIESLQYSFQGVFSYVPSGAPYPSDRDLGTPLFYCVSEKDRIYADFDCAANPLIANNGAAELNDIRNLLPYSDAGRHYFAQLVASTNTKSGYTIVITYTPGESFYETGNVEEYHKKYRAEIEDYLTSHGQDLADYDFFEKWK